MLTQQFKFSPSLTVYIVTLKNVSDFRYITDFNGLLGLLCNNVIVLNNYNYLVIKKLEGDKLTKLTKKRLRGIYIEDKIEYNLPDEFIKYTI